jgi:hypothetical protein
MPIYILKDIFFAAILKNYYPFLRVFKSFAEYKAQDNKK